MIPIITICGSILIQEREGGKEKWKREREGGGAREGEGCKNSLPPLSHSLTSLSPSLFRSLSSHPLPAPAGPE